MKQERELPRSPRRSAAEWLEIVREQSESGESVRRFAEARDLNPSTLTWWKSESRRRTPVPMTGRSASPSRTGNGAFVELVPPGNAAASECAYSVMLSSGIIVRATEAIDVEAFVRLVAELQRAC